MSTPSLFNEDLSYAQSGPKEHFGGNLGSLNIAKTMDSPDFARTIEGGDPRVDRGERPNPYQVRCPQSGRAATTPTRSGLRTDELHGYLARERIFYGSGRRHRLHQHLLLCGAVSRVTRASNRIAIERGTHFKKFRAVQVRVREFLLATPTSLEPKTQKVRQLFADMASASQRRTTGTSAQKSVPAHIYNQNLQAVPPKPRSHSYINHSTSSILPMSKVEILEGKIGRVYYPAFAVYDQRQPGVLRRRLRSVTRRSSTPRGGHPA